MKKFNDLQISNLQNLSEELAIDVSFLEKDYYVTKLLYLLSDIENENFKLIFSGGTCLSKAYLIIKRFSEDIDLRIQESKNSLREERRIFIDNIIKLINDNKDFKVISVKKEDTSHRIILNIEYGHIAENNQFLRPEIKLELFFNPLKLKVEGKEILSLIDRYMKNDKNTFNISCINVIELAAEKYSALLWRTLYSNKETYEPTLIRHLYDLAMLKKEILSNKKLFKEILLDIYNQDKIKRDKHNKFDNIQDAFKQLYLSLKNENKFKNFYQNFVQNMCYDTSNKTLSFEQALKALKEISNSVL